MIGKVYAMYFIGILVVYIPMVLFIISAGLTQETISPLWWAVVYLVLFLLGMFWYNYYTKKVDKGILEHHKEASK